MRLLRENVLLPKLQKDICIRESVAGALLFMTMAIFLTRNYPAKFGEFIENLLPDKDEDRL